MSADRKVDDQAARAREAKWKQLPPRVTPTTTSSDTSSPMPVDYSFDETFTQLNRLSGA